MTTERYDEAYRAFEEAEQLLFKYQGLLKRALDQFDKNFDRFHIYGLSGPEYCHSAGVDFDDGVDGRTFPNAEKIAMAVCKRSIARDTMRAIWPRLTQEERASRQGPA